MAITILTTGTRGDIQPYIALGVALRKAGCGVRVAAFENFRSFVSSFGLEFCPIAGDVSEMVLSDIGREAVRADSPLKVFISFSKLKSFVFDMQKHFLSACKGAEAIVYHPGAPIGYFLAQRFEIPSILATPFPMTPTRDYPSLVFYNGVRLGRKYNLLTHKLFEKGLWLASRSAVKRFWELEFGRSPSGFSCPYSKQVTRNLPTVVSCSQYVFPRPKDWPEGVHMAGYWFLDEHHEWRPSSELLEFLKRGDPPVYVGFGSIGDPTAGERTTQTVIDALKRCGQRGILATGWNGLSRIDKVPEDILFLQSIPHSWLFPRMAAVVHHGGAGTTAAGLRAGVPSVIVPHGNDQFAWGRRIYELGVGAKPVPRKNLTAEKLADAIDYALSGEIKDAARNLGRKVRTERGAEAAAEVIIDCLREKAFATELPRR